MQDNLDKDKRVIPPKHVEHSEEEQCIDEALYDTFPASDPPQSSPQKSEPAGVPTPEEIDRAERADQSKKD